VQAQPDNIRGALGTTDTTAATYRHAEGPLRIGQLGTSNSGLLPSHSRRAHATPFTVPSRTTGDEAGLRRKNSAGAPLPVKTRGPFPARGHAPEAAPQNRLAHRPAPGCMGKPEPLRASTFVTDDCFWRNFFGGLSRQSCLLGATATFRPTLGPAPKKTDCRNRVGDYFDPARADEKKTGEWAGSCSAGGASHRGRPPCDATGCAGILNCSEFLPDAPAFYFSLFFAIMSSYHLDSSPGHLEKPKAIPHLGPRRVGFCARKFEMGRPDLSCRQGIRSHAPAGQKEKKKKRAFSVRPRLPLPLLNVDTGHAFPSCGMRVRRPPGRAARAPELHSSGPGWRRHRPGHRPKCLAPGGNQAAQPPCKSHPCSAAGH